MQKRLLILNIAAAALVTLGWILAAAGVALGEWSNTDGATATTSSAFGAVNIEQRSGLYQTITTTCCQVNGVSVPDQNGAICDTANPCTTSTYTTANFCDFVDAETAEVDRGRQSVNCTSVQAGSVLAILLTLIVIIGHLVVVGLFLGKKIKCGVFAGGLTPMVVASLLSIIFYKVLSFDEINSYMESRYSGESSTSSPITTSLGDSFSLLVASFVFQLLGWICAILRWALRPKPRPTPAPRVIYTEPYEEPEPEIRTPHRAEVNPTVEGSPTGGSPLRTHSSVWYPSGRKALAEEQGVSSRAIQPTIQPYGDTVSSRGSASPSANYRQQNQINPVRTIPISPPTQLNTASANNRIEMGSLETVPTNGGGGDLKRTPTWLRPSKPTPGSMEEAERQRQIMRSQSNVGNSRTNRY